MHGAADNSHAFARSRPGRRRTRTAARRRAKPKVKKLRLALILVGLLRAGRRLDGVRDDDGRRQRPARSSRTRPSSSAPRTPRCSPTGKDKPGEELATLTGNQNRILVEAGRDLPEHQERGDRDRGPPLLRARGRGLPGHRARAVPGRLRQQSAAQGGSTITQQFVKNALAAQGNRSVFQKLREAALAYHLERKWTKQKVLTQYLNSVYFGNGAYGVEAAVRTYFRGDTDDDAATTPTGLTRGRSDRRREDADGRPRGAGRDARRGGAAGRDHRLAEPVRPGREPAPREAAARPRARAACSSRS